MPDPQFDELRKQLLGGGVSPRFIERTVLELREHLGAGYRVYFGRHGLSIVILLCGGSKKTQATDIKTAKTYWADWKRRQA